MLILDEGSQTECRAVWLSSKIELVKPEGCERARGLYLHYVGKCGVLTKGKLIGAESMNVSMVLLAFMHQVRARSKSYFVFSMVLYSISAVMKLWHSARSMDHGDSAPVALRVMLKFLQCSRNSSLMNPPPFSDRNVSGELEMEIEGVNMAMRIAVFVQRLTLVSCG